MRLCSRKTVNLMNNRYGGGGMDSPSPSALPLYQICWYLATSLTSTFLQHNRMLLLKMKYLKCNCLDFGQRVNE